VNDTSPSRPPRPDLPSLLPALLTADAGPPGSRSRRSPRDWAVDVVAFVLALAFGTLSFLEVVDTAGFTWWRVVDLVIGASALTRAEGALLSVLLVLKMGLLSQ
jgi:hypothetical protein